MLTLLYGATVIYSVCKYIASEVWTMATNYLGNGNTTMSETQSDCCTVSHTRSLRSNSHKFSHVSKVKDYHKRFNSFSNLPTPHYIHPSVLAKHGFRYSNRNQTCICTGCQKQVKEWKTGDRPENKKFHGSDCQYATETEESSTNDVQESDKPEDMEVAEVNGDAQTSNTAFHSLQVENARVSQNSDHPASMPVMHAESRNSIATPAAESTASEDEVLDRLTPLPPYSSVMSDASGPSGPLASFHDLPARDPSAFRPVPSRNPLNLSNQDETSSSRSYRPVVPVTGTRRNDDSTPPDVILKTMDMKLAENRLVTFEWFWSPENVFKNNRLLVICGFFCIGQGDAVKCFFCQLVLANWKRDDDPCRRHLECSPRCRFALGENCGNIPLPRENRRRRREPQSNRHWSHSSRNHRETQVDAVPTPETEPLSIQQQGPAVPPEVPEPSPVEGSRPLPDEYANLTEAQRQRAELLLQFPCENPANPAMREEHARLQTFTNSQFRNHTNLRASNETLAQAGLYYIGPNDSTKCWFCDGGLRDFEANDDPWVEHCKYFPECQYLLQQRGPSWISSISELYPDIVRPILPSRANEVLPQVASTPTAPQSQGQMSPSQERVLTASMNLPPAQAVRGMGFSEEEIRGAQMRRIIRLGNSYPNAEALIEGILNPNAELEEAQGATYQPPGNVIDMSGRTITISGGNFIGPSIVNGRLIRGNRRSGNVSINGMSLDEYLQHQNAMEYNDDMPVEFDNVGSTVSASSSSIDGPSTSHDSALTDESSTSGFQQDGTPEERLEALQKEYQCKICYNSRVQVLFQPCGHVVTCIRCARRVNSCPVCRKAIRSRLRTYHS